MDLVLVAWNLEATDGDGEEELMNELRTVIGDEFFDGAQAMITIARARKRALFPDDRRLLVNMKITDRPEGPHVQVATAIYDKP